MLSPREAFRIGFLLRCADEGLAPQEAHERVKSAQAIMKQAGIVGDVLGHGKSLLSTGGAGLIALPLMAGVGGGYLAHKAVEDDTDIEDLRKRELIEELKRATRHAKLKKHKEEPSSR